MTSSHLHELIIRIAEAGPDRDACFAIRQSVFVKEQQIPEQIEYDATDSTAVHLLARRAAQPVGCARWVREGDEARIGRLAVMPDARRQGIGSLLVRHALDSISAAAIHRAMLHAQVSVCPFYEALGFLAEGEEFLEAGIPHILMRRSLP